MSLAAVVSTSSHAKFFSLPGLTWLSTGIRVPTVVVSGTRTSVRYAFTSLVGLKMWTPKLLVTNGAGSAVRNFCLLAETSTHTVCIDLDAAASGASMLEKLL